MCFSQMLIYDSCSVPASLKYVSSPRTAYVTGCLGKVGLNVSMVTLTGAVTSRVFSGHQHTISNKSSKHVVKLHYGAPNLKKEDSFFPRSTFFSWKCRALMFPVSVVLRHILENILIEIP